MDKRHVAVIVVHGVGDPGATNSVCNVASILLGLRKVEHERSVFQPFACEPIQIGVRAAPIIGAASVNKGKEDPSIWAWLDERAPTFAVEEGEPHQPSPLPDDVAYTRDQLQEYKAGVGRNESTYSTTRLTGVRRGETEADGKVVHLYEMYWADLVSLRKGLRLLEDLYQLILHIAHIGLLALNAAMTQEGFGDKPLKWFARSHRGAVRILTLPIAIFNLMTIPLAGLALTALIPDDANRRIAYGLLGFLLLCASGCLRYYMIRRKLSRGFISIAFVGLLGVAVLLGWAAHASDEAGGIIIGLSAYAICMAGVMVLLHGYEKIRPGALRVSWALGFLVVLDLVVETIYEIRFGYSPHNLHIALHVGGAIMSLLSVCWIAMLLCNLSSVGCALYALFVQSELKGAKKRRALQTVATALLSLSLPTVAFFLVNTLISTGVIYTVVQKLPKTPGEVGGALVRYAPSWVVSAKEKVVVDNLQDFVKRYWFAIAGFPLIPLAILLGLALLCAVWAIIPSVLSELNVPDDDPSPGCEGAWRRKVYAKWLDSSQGVLWCAGILVYVASMAITPAAIIGYTVYRPDARAISLLPPSSSIGKFLDGVYGALVGVFVAGTGSFWLLPQRVSSLFGRFAVPTRAALDIDAYLRRFPVDGNPRARIFARYTSLLRYITNWSEPTDSNVHYDSIVIVSHSQGTVITADLFRYLTLGKAQDPSLERLDALRSPRTDMIPVHLLTMGCPLRQLYGARFPYLYQWANKINQRAAANMGIHQWINAYRSGDYVGRNLIKSESYWTIPYKKGSKDFCVGPGAHLHYWDGTAKCVANVIDDLIQA